MRIAYVVHRFPPESLGGTEIYTWSLGRALAAEGHEVSVFYPQAGLAPAEARVERDGLRLWRAALPAQGRAEGPARQFLRTLRDAASETAFARFMVEARPEVVHLQHLQGLSARLILLARGRPRVATLHDYWYFCPNAQLVRPDRSPCEGPGDGRACVDCATERAGIGWLRMLRPALALPLAYRNALLRQTAREVDLFLAPSDFLRALYIRQGFQAERILTIENGLDLERLEASSASALPEPPARPHFGFIGSLAWQKGAHVLIEAFNALPQNASLTIYGDESVFPEYAASLKRMARHPHIRFGGRLDYRAVGAALRQMDCLVVPSLWYENSPLVIQEAYGLKVPVVASRLGALVEKVRDGETGWLFAPGDSADLARVLQELIEEPHRLQAVRANLRPAPSMRDHAQQILRIYQALTQGNRP